jgi:hypothetical protein
MFGRFLLILILSVLMAAPAEIFAGAFLMDVTSAGRKVIRRWKKPHVRWRYNPTGAPEGFRDAIESAFAIWENQTGSPITNEYLGETTSTEPADNDVTEFIFSSDFKALGAPSSAIAITLLNSQMPKQQRRTVTNRWSLIEVVRLKILLLQISRLEPARAKSKREVSADPIELQNIINF